MYIIEEIILHITSDTPHLMAHTHTHTQVPSEASLTPGFTINLFLISALILNWSLFPKLTLTLHFLLKVTLRLIIIQIIVTTLILKDHKKVIFRFQLPLSPSSQFVTFKFNEFFSVLC